MVWVEPNDCILDGFSSEVWFGRVLARNWSFDQDGDGVDIEWSAFGTLVQDLTEKGLVTRTIIFMLPFCNKLASSSKKIFTQQNRDEGVEAKQSNIKQEIRFSFSGQTWLSNSVSALVTREFIIWWQCISTDLFHTLMKTEWSANSLNLHKMGYPSVTARRNFMSMTG